MHRDPPKHLQNGSAGITREKEVIAACSLRLFSRLDLQVKHVIYILQYILQLNHLKTHSTAPLMPHCIFAHAIHHSPPLTLTCRTAHYSQRYRHNPNSIGGVRFTSSPLLSESQDHTQFATPSSQSPFGARWSTASPLLSESQPASTNDHLRERDRVRHAEVHARDPREYIAHVLAVYEADPSALIEADSHRYHGNPSASIDVVIQRYNASPATHIDDVLERYRDNIEEARTAARERAQKYRMALQILSCD